MKKKLIIIIPLVIAVSVFIGVYAYFNHKDAKTNLTVKEKNWISNHSQTKYDFEVINNYPIFSSAGNGVILDFIKDFQIDTDLEFNKMAYNKEQNTTTSSLRIRILPNDVSLSEKDLLIAVDGYVLVSTKEARYNELSELSNAKIGLFTGDVGEVSYYLKNSTDITYEKYDSIDKITKALDDGDVDYIVVPQNMYLQEILGSEGYIINYYFTEMSKKIVLTLTDDNEDLNKIVKKYFDKWKSDYYVSSYNDNYLKFYISTKKINDKTKADMLSKSYVYGYVENTPYEEKDSKKLAGIAGEYISRLQRLTDIDLTYKKYKNVEELTQAIQNGEIDIYFNYYNLTTEKYSQTMSPFIERYAVLKKENSNENVTTFEELKGKAVNMIGNNAIYTYFSSNSKANINVVEDISDLDDNDNLIVVDYEIYNYYRNTKFKNYEMIYSDDITTNFTFGVLKSDKDLYELFNYIMTTNSYYNYRTVGLNSLDSSSNDGGSFQQIYLVVFGIVLLILLVAILFYLFFKNRKKKIVIRKEDRRKYTDILTSLKNRNYLNLNIQTWEESKVYPQTIVMVDLNNIKYVNDNYGHEAGDNLIVSAASILVNTQLENSEIIRTDGNEFLIYLVGYTEKQIDTYCKKLTKEFKELPYGFGAALGYSMINDDIKTIDDAINEATLEMKTVKEDLK